MPLRRAHTAAAVLLVLVAVTLAVPSMVHAAAQPRLIVGFTPTTSNASRATTLGRAGIATKSTVRQLDAVVVRVAPGKLAATRRALLARPGVAYVEIDHVARIYGGEARVQWRPNDTFVSQQWSLDTLGAPAAWELARGAGVTIGVLDTGVDYIHPDLAGRVDKGRDFVDSDNDPMDVQGHGTHVAGIAAATADDRFGVAGLAPEARILAVRVLDDEGAGNYSQVANGIVFAADRGADVINLSLGGPEQSELLRAALDYAAARGVIVTCATGNDSAASIGYPARYDSCIAVGATDIADEHASFSNTGAGIDLVAPGVQVLSSVMGGSHDSWDGTSMASPQVAGVAALLRSQGLGRRAIDDTMSATARDLGKAGADTTFGAGRVDAAAAVTAASRQVRAAADTVAPTVTSVGIEPVRRTTTRASKLQWKVRSRTGFTRVGSTTYRASYTYSKTSTRGATRTVDTFKFRNGVVYRRRVVSVRSRVVTRVVKVVLPIKVAAGDDQGVDRVSVMIDGRVAGIDWNAGDGWSITAACTPGTHQFIVSAWDAANNEGTASLQRRIRC